MFRIIDTTCKCDVCGPKGYMRGFPVATCPYSIVLHNIVYYKNNAINPNSAISELFKVYANHPQHREDGIKAIENAIIKYPEYERLWNMTRILM